MVRGDVMLVMDHEGESEYDDEPAGIDTVRNVWLLNDYSWIEPPVHTHTHTQLIPVKTDGLRQIQDHHWKALDKENPNMRCLFLCDPFDFFFK